MLTTRSLTAARHTGPFPLKRLGGRPALVARFIVHPLHHRPRTHGRLPRPVPRAAQRARDVLRPRRRAPALPHPRARPVHVRPLCPAASTLKTRRPPTIHGPLLRNPAVPPGQSDGTVLRRLAGVLVLGAPFPRHTRPSGRLLHMLVSQRSDPETSHMFGDHLKTPASLD